RAVRRQLGWLGHVEIAAGDSARHHALHDLRFARAGCRRHAIPRRANALAKQPHIGHTCDMEGPRQDRWPRLELPLYTPAADHLAASFLVSALNSNERKRKMMSVPTKTGYAQVDDLRMYYEIHGSGGVPLVLLHGAFSAIGTSFEKLLPSLSANRQVIAFELQAHGRTADIDRPMSLEAMADDVAAALQQLNITQADVLGYSMGAAVALHLTLRHP